MNYLFIFSSALVFLRIVLLDNSFCHRALFGAATILYGLPLMFGTAVLNINSGSAYPYFFREIAPEIYGLFWVLQILFLISTLFPIASFRGKHLIKSEYFWTTIIGSLLFSYLFIWTTTIEKLVTVDKTERLTYMTNWYYYAVTSCVLSVIFFMKLERRSLSHYFAMIVPAMFFILEVCLQNRVNLILGFFSIIIAYFAEKKKQISVLSKIAVFFVVVSFVFSIFSLKIFYYRIIFGTFKLANIGDYYFHGVLDSEPFCVATTLNESFHSPPSLPESYELNSILQYIPFMKGWWGIPSISYNDIYQRTMFPDIPWGLASSCFAELYVIGGWLAIFIYISFLFFVLVFQIPQSSFAKAIFYYWYPFLLFYFFRNDWHFFLGIIRHTFLTIIFLLPILIPLKLLKGLVVRSQFGNLKFYGVGSKKFNYNVFPKGQSV